MNTLTFHDPLWICKHNLQKKRVYAICTLTSIRDRVIVFFSLFLKGLAQAEIIKKSVILFRVLNMTIWCKHVQRLELQIFKNFVLRIHQLG